MRETWQLGSGLEVESADEEPEEDFLVAAESLEIDAPSECMARFVLGKNRCLDFQTQRELGVRPLRRHQANRQGSTFHSQSQRNRKEYQKRDELKNYSSPVLFQFCL